MKNISFISLLTLALLLTSSSSFAGSQSLLSIRCNQGDRNTKIYLNGEFKGDCSNNLQLNLFLTPGKYQVKAVKAVGSDKEQTFKKTITTVANSPKRLWIKLSQPQYTVVGQKRADREAKLKAERKYRKGKIEAKRELYEANLGNVSAMRALVKRYKDGIGVKRDHTQVVKWQEKIDVAERAQQKFSNETNRAEQDAFLKSFTADRFVKVKGGCYPMGCGGGNRASLSDIPVWQYPLAAIAAVLPVGCASLSTHGTNDCGLHEKPVHTVCLDDFHIGKYEVTQGEYQRIMGKNPSHLKKGDQYPVERVSWDDTQQFIEKLNEKTGKTFRLPTEAEWEYAARSGGEKGKYSGGNHLSSVAWYKNNSGGHTHPVGQKRANGLGLYDMTGNVWEWCNDRYYENYYKDSPRDNPQGPTPKLNSRIIGTLELFQVIRGGSYVDGKPVDLRVTSRYGMKPSKPTIDVGFRLVLSAEQ